MYLEAVYLEAVYLEALLQFVGSILEIDYSAKTPVFVSILWMQAPNFTEENVA